MPHQACSLAVPVDNHVPLMVNQEALQVHRVKGLGRFLEILDEIPLYRDGLIIFDIIICGLSHYPDFFSDP